MNDERKTKLRKHIATMKVIKSSKALPCVCTKGKMEYIFSSKDEYFFGCTICGRERTVKGKDIRASLIEE